MAPTGLDLMFNQYISSWMILHDLIIRQRTYLKIQIMLCTGCHIHTTISNHKNFCFPLSFSFCKKDYITRARNQTMKPQQKQSMQPQGQCHTLWPCYFAESQRIPIWRILKHGRVSKCSHVLKVANGMVPGWNHTGSGSLSK